MWNLQVAKKKKIDIRNEGSCSTRMSAGRVLLEFGHDDGSRKQKNSMNGQNNELASTKATGRPNCSRWHLIWPPYCIVANWMGSLLNLVCDDMTV
jgi:hypothetical protein